MKIHQPRHRVLKDFSQFKFVGIAKAADNIPETVGYAANEIHRILPHLGIFAKMVVKEIIQPVLNNVFDHIMTPVLCQEHGESRQVSVRKWLFIYVIEDL